MTEAVIASLVIGLFVGAIAALVYRIFSRLREIEETLIDEILDTQELVLDVYEEIRKSTKSSEDVSSEGGQDKT
jgi:biopolymer transport protein ExbB/TolQ